MSEHKKEPRANLEEAARGSGSASHEPELVFAAGAAFAVPPFEGCEAVEALLAFRVRAALLPVWLLKPKNIAHVG